MQDGSIPQILNKVEVNEGDCFFIHPGTIHAIGAGVVDCGDSAEFQYDSACMTIFERIKTEITVNSMWNEG